MDTATLFSTEGLPGFPISDQLCTHDSLPILNSTFKALSARNQILAKNKISKPINPNPYDILTWSSTYKMWDAVKFAGFGQLTARAWAIFKTQGESAPILLDSFNVKEVIFRPERPTGDISQFNVMYRDPLSHAESCLIASGSIPNSQGKDVGIPEIDTKGDPALFFAGSTPGSMTNSPEIFYKTETNPEGIPPVEWRNHCTVLWRPNNGMPPVDTLISIVIFSRIIGNAALYEDPSLKVLQMSYEDLAIGTDKNLFV